MALTIPKTCEQDVETMENPPVDHVPQPWNFDVLFLFTRRESASMVSTHVAKQIDTFKRFQEQFHDHKGFCQQHLNLTAATFEPNRAHMFESIGFFLPKQIGPK